MCTPCDQARRSSTTATTNTLERFYGTQNSESIPIQTTRTQYGIPADELPHVDVVSDSVRKNIVEGKYVNLACLLIPEFEAPSVSVNEFSGIELLHQGRRDHRLDRILNITQFYKAFGIYKRVMCETFPQRRPELDLYEADIGNIFEHYGEIFYAYHCQFTKKAAAYLEKGVKIDWSKRNKDLFQLLVGGVKTKLCDHCLQSDHQAPFCPTQYYVQTQSSKGTKQNEGDTRKVVATDRSIDIHGRARIKHMGREICNNFNNSYCRRDNCSFIHICKKCRSEAHGESKCEAQRVSSNVEMGQKSKSNPSS